MVKEIGYSVRQQIKSDGKRVIDIDRCSRRKMFHVERIDLEEIDELERILF